MRYSSSSASRSPCWARSTSRRTFSFESAAARLIRLCFPTRGSGLTRLGGGEAHATGATEPAEVRDLGHDHVVRALFRVEDDHPWPVLVQRTFQLVGGLLGREAADHLPSAEPDLDPNPGDASHSTPP